MKRSHCILLVLWLAAGATELQGAKVQDYNVMISPYIVDQDGHRWQSGTGSFTVSDGGSGQASFYFAKDGQRFAITAGTSLSQTRTVSMLMTQGEAKIPIEQVSLAVDLMFSEVNSEGQGLVKFNGVLNKILRFDSSGSAGSDFRVQQLDFSLAEGQPHTIVLNDRFNGGKICVDISYVSTAAQKADRKEEPNVRFDVSYRLDYKNGDATGQGTQNCQLGLGLDRGDDVGSCVHQQIFWLPDGDSLLYMFTCDIENPRVTPAGQVKFNLEVSHVYALNPDLSKDWTELRSDKTTVVLFDKEISAAIGGVTEVEIPKDDSNPLPFPVTETLVLRNIVTGR